VHAQLAAELLAKGSEDPHHSHSAGQFPIRHSASSRCHNGGLRLPLFVTMDSASRLVLLLAGLASSCSTVTASNIIVPDWNVRSATAVPCQLPGLLSFCCVWCMG
jgi:hypothetical protein